MAGKSAKIAFASSSARGRSGRPRSRAARWRSPAAAPARSGQVPYSAQRLLPRASVPGTPTLIPLTRWDSNVVSPCERVGVHRGRSRLARVDRVDLAVARGVDRHEAAPADAARVRLDDAEDAGGPDRGVDGVPAVAQDVDRGLRGPLVDAGGGSTYAHRGGLLGRSGGLVSGGWGGEECGGQERKEQAAHAERPTRGPRPHILPRSHGERHGGHEVRRDVGRRRRADQARRPADRRQARGRAPRRRRALRARQGDRRADRDADEVSPHPDPREMDMLLSTGERMSCALCAMAINDLGHRAISLTGSQAGIVTDTSHTKARILDVRADRIRAALDEDLIVLVAGFQGVSTARDVTTLGRGGSDTTAVALAAARRRRGVRDLHRRAGRVQRRPADRARRAQAAGRLVRGDARDGGVGRRRAAAALRSSTRATTACGSTAAPASTTAPGTVVVAEEETMEHPLITAVTHSRDEARITLHRRARPPGHRRPHLHRAGRRQREHRHDHPERAARPRAARADMSFTVPREDLRARAQALEPIAAELGIDGRHRRVDGQGLDRRRGNEDPPGRRRQGLHRRSATTASTSR